MGLINCQNCGKEMNDTEKSCSNCGNQLLNIATETYLVNKTNHTKLLTPKKQKIVIAVSVIGLIFAGCIMFAISSIMNDDYNKAKSYYSKNDTSSMAQLYTTMSDVDSNKIFDYLEKNAQRVSDDYITEKVPYEDAISKMDKIKLFYKQNSISGKFESLNSNILKLYQSRKSYDIAENAELNNMHEIAYQNYKKVIETDLNYNIANDKMNILRPIIASQLFTSAKQEYEASNYSNALDYMFRALNYDHNNPDMMKFMSECLAKNTAQKTAQMKEYYNEITTVELPTVLPTIEQQ